MKEILTCSEMHAQTHNKALQQEENLLISRDFFFFFYVSVK